MIFIYRPFEITPHILDLFTLLYVKLLNNLSYNN